MKIVVSKIVRNLAPPKEPIKVHITIFDNKDQALMAIPLDGGLFDIGIQEGDIVDFKNANCNKLHTTDVLTLIME